MMCRIGYPKTKKDCQRFRLEPQTKKIKSRKPKKTKACHAIKIYYSIADKQRNGASDNAIYYIVVYSVACPKTYTTAYKWLYMLLYASYKGNTDKQYII